MKTFETMKHNIPEGATHYRDESDDFRFSWVMFGDGGALNVYTTALGWCRFNHSKFEDKVKPIPKIPTETKEDKEALDEKTYRYEKVEASEAVYWFTKTNDALFAEPDSSQQYDDLQHYIYNLDECGSSSLYRRIEVTERNEFIEKSCEIIRTSAKEDILIIGKMFDAGCRFVNGKG